MREATGAATKLTARHALPFVGLRARSIAEAGFLCPLISNTHPFLF
jgi:hypothetical protein